MDTVANNDRTWKWAALFTAAFVLPLFFAPMLATATGWPIQITVMRLMIGFAVAVLLARVGMPRDGWPGRLGRSVATTLLAMLITVAFCALYSFGLILAEAESLRPWSEIFKPTRLLTALGTGIAVSVIEEPVFRHYLLRKLSIRGSVVAGALLSSAIYALAHYARPASVPIKPTYTLADSWGVYENIFTNLSKPLEDPFRGLGLLLFGLLLCVVVRWGGLRWTIGVHIGVVYYIKADACLIYWNHQGRHPMYGSFNVLYDGALFWIVCASVLVAMLVFTSSSKPSTSGPPATLR